MRTLVSGEVDGRDRLLHRAKRRIDDRARRSDESEHGAVVIGIGLAVEHHDFGHSEDRLHDRIDLHGVAPLAEIRNALNELSGHEGSEYQPESVSGLRPTNCISMA